MATFDRTWTVSINNAFSSAVDQVVQYKEAAYALKALLVSAGWTIPYSSNGTTASAADNIASSSDIVVDTSANPRSYFIAQAPAAFLQGGELFQIMFDCQDTAPGTVPNAIDMSFVTGTAFVTGSATTSTPPTGGQNMSGTSLGFESNFIPWASPISGQWASWRTTVGDVMFGIRAAGGNGFRNFLIIYANRDADGGGYGGHRWLVAGLGGTTDDVLTGNNLGTYTSSRFTSISTTGVQSDTANASFQTEGVWNMTSWPSGAEAISGEPRGTIGIWSNNATAGRNRYYGQFRDWRSAPDATPFGTVVSGDGDTQRLVVIGSLWAPVTAADLPFT